MGFENMTTFSDDHGPQLDQKTLQLELLLLQIAEAAQQHIKQYYFGGGFAIDLTFGGLTRPHEDIDFYPMENDTQWWKDWFRSQGYIVSKDSDMEVLPNAFSVISTSYDNFDKNRDYLADVYPIAIGSNGGISMAVAPGTHEVWDGMLTISDGRGLWPGKSWNDVKSVSYKGRTVVIENYRTVLMQKEEYINLHNGETLSEKHLRDFERAAIKPEV